MKRKFIAILLVLVLLAALSACTKEKPTDETNPNGTEDTQPDDGNVPETENMPEEDERPEIKAGFLKGPTGMGAAYLMEQDSAGKTLCDYDITVETDAANINSALISGNLDIAAVPTNAASLLYNKTDGEVQIVAINTLGVLYILENGNEIMNISDLAGKTVYATGQGANPQYVLEYILRENDLYVGENVNVEYLAADELASRMAAGDIEVCMLPVPNVTAVMEKNPDVRMAVSLTDEWQSVTGGDSVLTQGCIVARKGAVSDEMLAAFLEDYEASINYMNDEANRDTAAALAVKYGIVANESVAKAAIPECNMTFMSDPDTMREALSGYYEILFSADPASIGGSVPDDAFYR